MGDPDYYKAELSHIEKNRSSGPATKKIYLIFAFYLLQDSLNKIK